MTTCFPDNVKARNALAPRRYYEGPGSLPRLTALFCQGLLLLFALVAGTLQAASLQGSIRAQDGTPLVKVPVCLRIDTSTRNCSKTQTTDRRGDYRFNGLKAGTEYQVSVLQSDSAAGRKFERYRTYVWEPVQQQVTLTGKNEALDLATFTGKFNFSNYQRGLTLTAADFPEMSSIDLVSDYVALKVFIPSGDPDIPPETIFLGQVTDTNSLKISASVPLAVAAISYQIYSANLTVNGIIQLN